MVFFHYSDRLAGGEGTFGVHEDLSHFFFSQDLKERLNRKLSNFLSASNKQLLDLDEDCLRVNPQRTLIRPIQDYHQTIEAAVAFPGMVGPAGVTGNLGPPPSKSQNLPATLKNASAEVKEHLSESMVILGEPGLGAGGWRCFLTAEHSLVPQGLSLLQALRLGQSVMLDAVLIDANRPIQYVAHLAWDRAAYPHQELVARDYSSLKQPLLQKYQDVSDMMDLARTVGSPAAAVAAPGPLAPPPIGLPPPPMPQTPYFECCVGVVVMLLDESYGIIQAGGSSNNFVLFDVCDFWVDPETTASKRGLELQNVVQQGSRVLFHAALLSAGNKVQYLASSVWLAEAPFPPESQPRPIAREDVHHAKEEIYNTVITTVDFSGLGGEASAAPQRSARGEVNSRQFGIVRLLFVCGHDPGALENIGGVLEVGHKTYCFFSRDNCSRGAKVAVGETVYCNNCRVKGSSWPGKVDFLALSVYSSSERVADGEEEATAKAAEGISRLKDIASALGGSTAFLDNLSNPILPIVNVTLPDKVAKRHGSSFSSSEQVVSSRNAKFKCMISDQTGILEDGRKLIYFEVSDVNIYPPLPLHDLVSVLRPGRGNKVQYQATRVEGSAGVIHLAAVTKGVQLLGALPNSLSSEARECKRTSTNPHHSTQVPTSASRDQARLGRYLAAEAKLRRGEVISVNDIALRKGRSSSSGAAPAPFPQVNKPLALAHQIGSVKTVLNENFGLITMKDGLGYCLFDTFDLHVGPNNETAAIREAPVESFLKNGDPVGYNACLIDDNANVPYLATAVWATDALPLGVEALPRASIQADKIDIYRQVVRSVAEMLKAPMARQPSQMMVKQEIKMEVKRERSTSPRSSSSSRVRLDIRDTNVVGRLHDEKGQKFAILKLTGDWSGDMALVHER